MSDASRPAEGASADTPPKPPPGRNARPHLVVAAHLDTAFPEETDVKVTRQGSVLRGPGIGDDCRGLAVLVGVVRLLQETKIATPSAMMTRPARASRKPRATRNRHIVSLHA